MQRKNKMGRHCERTVWALGRGHHPSRGKANFQPSVDSSNPGSGNGKRNRINSRLPHCVSNLTLFFYPYNRFEKKWEAEKNVLDGQINKIELQSVNQIVNQGVVFPDCSAREENLCTSKQRRAGTKRNLVACHKVHIVSRKWWVFPFIYHTCNEFSFTENSLQYPQVRISSKTKNFPPHYLKFPPFYVSLIYSSQLWPLPTSRKSISIKSSVSTCTK